LIKNSGVKALPAKDMAWKSISSANHHKEKRLSKKAFRRE